ncbi:MAG: hypothetical protein NTY22_07740, partial [Proteobacteria bacterium]|nr:hypothetical protein [Pseudomonadota bacterium]
KKTVTIMTPFSGRWACIYQYFKSIQNLNISGLDVRIVFYDNSCDEDFGKLLQAFLKTNKKKYKSFSYIVDQNNPLAGVGEMKDMAIGRIMNTFKKYIGKSKYSIVIEDDTAVPENTLQKLIFDIETMPKAGIVQGIEVGRHNSNFIGVTRIDEIYHYPPIDGKPNPELIFNGCMTLQTYGNKTSGVEEIGGGGFYCSLFKSDVYKKIDFEGKVIGSTSVDVIVGPKVRRLGLPLALGKTHDKK